MLLLLQTFYLNYILNNLLVRVDFPLNESNVHNVW